MVEKVLPEVHHEKTVYYDKVAQISLAAGNVEACEGWFRKCYDMSVLACGVENPNTYKLKAIVENPPKTVEELMALYDSDEEGEEGEGGEDGEWEDVEDDEDESAVFNAV